MMIENRKDGQLPLPKPTRALWGDTRPIAIIAPERTTLGHADYTAAKAGDIDAATRLVADLMDGSTGKLQRQIRKTNPVGAPVHAIEGLSYNVIPVAMAEYIGLQLGLRTSVDLQQINRVRHTGSGGYHRLATPALFAGNVIVGEKYLLVDDFVGQGGTLANLRGHIEASGGDVVGMVSLTGQRRSATLAVTDDSLKALRNKYEDLESWWSNIYGYGFAALTESEARYLFNSPDADTIRDRIIQAARAAGGG